ncbi:MAG: tetratricopeptide repeat protein [Candidatus Auribacterota bacterium]
MRCIVVLLILFCACIPPLAAQEPDLLNATYEQALDYLRTQKFAHAAIAFYNVQRNPANQTWQRNSARELFEACMASLRSNPPQADLFGSMISLQQDDHTMQVLMSRYVSILEHQQRQDKLIETQRFVVRLWPTSQNKYTLAYQMQRSGSYQEAFDLYGELVSDNRYKVVALRQMMELIPHIADGEKALSDIVSIYKKDIYEHYDLARSLYSALLALGKIKPALVLALDMAHVYAHSIDMMVSQMTAALTAGGMTVDELMNYTASEKITLTADKRYFLAKLLASTGNFERAVEILGYDTSLQTLEYRADLLYSAGSISLAGELYRSLLDQFSPQAQWYQRLADIAFREGDDQSAIEYLNKYLEYAGTDAVNAYFFVGRTLEQHGYTEEAERIYLKGKQESPNRNMVSMELIKYYLSQKNFASAAAEIYESQSMNQIAASSLYHSIKNSFSGRDEVQKVIYELDKILTAGVESGAVAENNARDVYFCLYTFAYEIGDIQTAVLYFKDYYRHGASSELMLIDLSEGLYQRGYTALARDLLFLLPPDSPHFGHAVRSVAQMYMADHEYEKVLTAFSDNPSYSDPYLIARAYFYLGKYDQAQAYVERTAQPSASLTILRGDILLAKGQFEPAADVYQSLSAVETEALALFSRGRAYLFWNKYDIALTVFEQLNREFPYSPEAAEALYIRTLLALMHNDEEAKRQWITASFLSWKHSFAEAYDVFSDMAKNYPDALFAPYILMDLYKTDMELKKTDQAAAHLKTLVERYPDSPLAPYALRLSIAQDSGIENKNDAYVDFLQTYPDSYDADLVRGELDSSGHQPVSDQPPVEEMP